MENTKVTMSVCTTTDKPQISILLALYRPNLEWLRVQLLSLNQQTYPNLQLYVRDDGSDKDTFEKSLELLAQCITAFPYEVKQNKKNLGSNKTFERLTEEATGEYFAFCDQDDRWLPEKLSVLEAELQKENVLLVCSDMYIMDAEGTPIADSITKLRRKHHFKSGAHLTSVLFFSNFVTGCTMLVDANIAKQAIPFCPYMVHDHYIALYCSKRGEISSLVKPLVRVRFHGRNQTEMMAGVVDKKSYEICRIQLCVDRMLWLFDNFPCDDRLKGLLQQGVLWSQARADNWKHRNCFNAICKITRHANFSPLTSVFELVATWMPEKLFMFFITLKKRNLI